MNWELYGKCTCVHHSEVTLPCPCHHTPLTGTLGRPWKSSLSESKAYDLHILPWACVPNPEHAPPSGGPRCFCFRLAHCLSPDVLSTLLSPAAEPSTELSPVLLQLLNPWCWPPSLYPSGKNYINRSIVQGISITLTLYPISFSLISMFYVQIFPVTNLLKINIVALLTLLWVCMVGDDEDPG